MRILIFSADFFPILGGVQTYVHLLAKGLCEWIDGECSGSIETIVVTETPSGDWDDSSLPYAVFRRPSILGLKKLIGGADIVHLAGPSFLPMCLSWLMGKPFVIEQHGYQAICPNGLLLLHPKKQACPGYFSMKRYFRCISCRSAEIGAVGGLKSFLFTFPRRWLCDQASANIAITKHVEKRLALSKAHTIYYGIHDGTQGPDLHGPGQVPLEISYIGRLVSEKGIPILLQAVQRLKHESVPVRLTLIGDGPQRGFLERLTRELQIEERIKFAGQMQADALAQATRNISVVVMPSIWEETAGLSAIEHMMRGKIVIAADIGGLSEVVGDAGLKFPVGDWKSLADRILEISRDPAWATAIGEKARKRALEQFSLKRMIREHMEIYSKQRPPQTSMRSGKTALS